MPLIKNYIVQKLVINFLISDILIKMHAYDLEYNLILRKNEEIEFIHAFLENKYYQ
jgi:hypothetical protein